MNLTVPAPKFDSFYDDLKYAVACSPSINVMTGVGDWNPMPDIMGSAIGHILSRFALGPSGASGEQLVSEQKNNFQHSNLTSTTPPLNMIPPCCEATKAIRQKLRRNIPYLSRS